MRRHLVVLLVFAAVAPLSLTQGRGLSFADRVAAQQAIDRVYYSHQTGAEKPFEEAVPRELLERKVVKYLKQSAALEKFWQTPMTAEMLERELQRMNRGTRMPHRLHELYAALGDDPLLIQETLVRAALVERLTRNFYASDTRLHGAKYAEADAQEHSLRTEIVKTSWDPWWRTVSEELDETAVASVASPDVSIAAGESPEGSCADDDTWGEMLTVDPSLPGRSEHTALWTGSLMLIWGGLGGEDSGGRYDPAIDSWLPISTVGAPTGRFRHTAIWTGTQMAVWGGTVSGGAPTNTGGLYDPAIDSWLPISTVGAPTSRTLHTAVWTGSRMVVFGGFEAESSGGLYDPATDSWQPTSTVGAPSGRHSHTAIWTGNSMAVWGGDDDSQNRLNTGGRYDPSTDSWAATSLVDAPLARMNHTAVWSGTEMVVWGGDSIFSGHEDTGARYDPATDSWLTTSTRGAPERRTDHAAVWTGNQMVIWGGNEGLGSNEEPIHTGARYDPATDSWTPTSTSGAAAARLRHTAVWTGSQMLVWGGKATPTVQLGNGARYQPATDSWSSMATAQLSGSPSPRRKPTAIWTGSHMVVWGGGVGGHDWPEVAYGSGGRYDPATDSWAATSMLDAPSARNLHSAVWTGNEMIIWGGRPFVGESVDSGARYEPLTDTWTATSTGAGVPSARILHTAVWTGSEMIVWGGVNSSGHPTSGGRYDPQSDSWSPTSTFHPPTGRIDQSAIWTGNEIVIWGGFNYSGGLDGARYYPATDSWSPMSEVDEPPWGLRHAAIWTGSEMVVWSQGWNNDGSPEPGVGGRYDPAADTWTLMAPQPPGEALAERYDATGVWTGSKMIVWGGSNGGSEWFDDGGRYDPATDSWSPTSATGAPSRRTHHVAVWTGSHMLVWGGFYLDQGQYHELGDGARYALGHTLDDDGDGYTECTGDCNDGNLSIFPGATELCDGLDNDCNFEVDDDAAPPEVAGLTFESEIAFSWQPGPPGLGSVHDISRGLVDELPIGSGTAEICFASEPGSTTTDLDVPVAGAGYWYLVRGRNDCGTGTYGQQSDTSERMTAVCP